MTFVYILTKRRRRVDVIYFYFFSIFLDSFFLSALSDYGLLSDLSWLLYRWGDEITFWGGLYIFYFLFEVWFPFFLFSFFLVFCYYYYSFLSLSVISLRCVNQPGNVSSIYMFNKPMQMNQTGEKLKSSLISWTRNFDNNNPDFRAIRKSEDARFLKMSPALCLRRQRGHRRLSRRKTKIFTERRRIIFIVKEFNVSRFLIFYFRIWFFKNRFSKDFFFRFSSPPLTFLPLLLLPPPLPLFPLLSLSHFLRFIIKRILWFYQPWL